MNAQATVGIVLVSHSAALAQGAAELAAQMGGGLVRVVAAGGTEDDRLGTSVDKVRRALAEADTGAGVLVLPDLGSSVLAVRTLIEQDGRLPAPLEVADAPFVEGAVAAVVAAATGGDIVAVLTAAQEARHARKL